MCSAEARILFVGQIGGQWSLRNRWDRQHVFLGVGQMRAILYTPLVMRVFVILPAAGIGTRMAAGGASTAAPKQFLAVGGVPVLVRSVRAFLAVPRVDAACVAVRPLIDPATIERTIDAVIKHGAAIVALPAVDTIKQVERTADGAIVTATIPRERIVQAQTPQGALFGLLRRAFVEAETDEFSGTDEASLLERAGIEVWVVSGSPR